MVGPVQTPSIMVPQHGKVVKFKCLKPTVFVFQEMRSSLTTEIEVLAQVQ